MNFSQRFTIGLAFGLLCLFDSREALTQPLLRQGDAEAEQRPEPVPEDLERRAWLRRRAELEEEQRLKQQEELMRMQGERLLAEREEIARKERMMNYALMIALLVIGATLLITFARSRIVGDDRGSATKE